ncbi:imidazole glycerol phosphate synthase subunit HisF [Meridianimarinicoccus roseus]|uniref:Imidazole glycerol phosphate synthase subunit HisF n=1 Tax=Meridianimarinicoccus roseus TaxID=2072018 RepID=A0A2V2LSZ3_9RHOB|nr:imidazole glycerol phosphate synthase cyclase subunit [Meridianimarinicoccus roseus]PWR04543.1 imidazole glycerol phosphate synthase subunit HisF [Meridianimarinicoccus roseus]
MLKKRIIPKFLIRDGRLVKGIEFFGGWREAGNPVSTAKVYDSYGVDEMIFLDIDATLQGRPANGRIIERVSEEVFMPLTVGGGITTLGQIEDLLKSGADKVAINSSAIADPGFITRAASRFGDQCIVVAIDYRSGPDGAKVHTRCGTEPTDLDAVDWALRMEDAHAGEIMMTSIDRDGTMDGYDLDMIASLANRLDKPLIASSGAGTLKHCMDALDAGASAITISSMFLFTDQSPIKVRSYLSTNGCNVRSQHGSRS